MIIRKCHGYRLEHIINDNFYASQFFTLVNFVKAELTAGTKHSKDSIDKLSKFKEQKSRSKKS